MKTTSEKKIKQSLKRYDVIKAEKSKLAKEEKEIKELLLKHLDLSESMSSQIGNFTFKKKVSSYGLNVSTSGVKIGEATHQLITSLLTDGKLNLLSIKPKTALLNELQEKEDPSTQALLKELGINVVEKYTLEVKKT